MNILSRDKQIEIIAALTEGVGIRAAARLVGVNRETVGKLALQIGKALAITPSAPIKTAPERRRRFRVIDGRKSVKTVNFEAIPIQDSSKFWRCGNS